MTRIVAGVARGRRLDVPSTGTRPTSDRVREAVFSALDHRVAWPGLRVLDLFAGSGALGLEALSRGAAGCTLVDSSAAAVTVLRKNAGRLGLAGSKAVRADATRLLSGGPDAEYDVVFLDPPYDLPDDVLAALVATLGSRDWLAAGAIVVVERATGSGFSFPDGFRPEWDRRFGDTRVQWAVWYGHHVPHVEFPEEHHA